ncbi:MAG: hypothetical protein ACHQUC_01430 [Chlamydiales bacterium]
MPGTDTIDITNLIEAMKTSWVAWQEAYIFGLIATIPGIGWAATPIAAALIGKLLTWALTKIANSAIQEAFFLATASRKGAQATAYLKAIEYKDSLPPTASDEEYEKAEKQDMEAFSNLVLLSN